MYHPCGCGSSWATKELRALWRPTNSRGEFSENTGKTECLLSPFCDTLTDREALPLLAIAADRGAPAGSAAGWKTENGRNNPVGGEQEQDDHQHAHRPGKRLQARVGPSAGGCAAGTLAPGQSARFKIKIESFRCR